MRTLLILHVALLTAAASLPAQDTGIAGYWKEPQGSVIHIAACGDALCATLAGISPSAPTTVDSRNPDPKLRQQPLCGLRIGQGFHQTSPDRAEGGTLYDPKSGKTYQGTMTLHGSRLDLRGFVGIALFGRSEHWERTGSTSCHG